MSFGGIVGRAILAFVDALAAGTLAGLAALLFVPSVFLDDGVEFAIVVTAVVTALFLAVALALSRLGEQPFPATRTVKVVAARVSRWV